MTPFTYTYSDLLYFQHEVDIKCGILPKQRELACSICLFEKILINKGKEKILAKTEQEDVDVL